MCTFPAAGCGRPRSIGLSLLAPDPCCASPAPLMAPACAHDATRTPATMRLSSATEHAQPQRAHRRQPHLPSAAHALTAGVAPAARLRPPHPRPVAPPPPPRPPPPARRPPAACDPSRRRQRGGQRARPCPAGRPSNRGRWAGAWRRPGRPCRARRQTGKTGQRRRPTLRPAGEKGARRGKAENAGEWGKGEPRKSGVHETETAAAATCPPAARPPLHPQQHRTSRHQQRGKSVEKHRVHTYSILHARLSRHGGVGDKADRGPGRSPKRGQGHEACRPNATRTKWA